MTAFGFCFSPWHPSARVGAFLRDSGFLFFLLKFDSPTHELVLL